MSQNKKRLCQLITSVVLAALFCAYPQTTQAPSGTGQRRPDTSFRPNNSQSRSSAPKVYAILVGISDYPGRSRDLLYCDTDPLNIRAGLEARHLASALTIRILINDRATRTAVREAFLELAPQVRAQDLFLFFYDGHGGRDILDMNRSTLTRSDLRSLLLHVKHGRRLVVLDSCEAGGFASAIRGLPNTAGLFAVRRNEGASTAPEHEAGGFLAYHFWQGILHAQTATSSSLFRRIKEGYGADETRQHPVLAGDQDLPLW